MRSRDILGAAGPLAKHLPGFTPRPSQQAMAHAVEATLGDAQTLVAESGTGTGKTFAYLVPAILSGLKIYISSGTRNLQDQLYRRDLPLVRSALAAPVATALLKGRSNYLCLHRLERTAAEERFASRAVAADFRRLEAWARQTKNGDIAEVSNVSEDSDLWPMVTSTADNCLGADCPRSGDCWVNRARREAAQAELLVINHHLFFADIGVREEGFAQLLPAPDAVIFDEAHQLPDIAGNFFGAHLSGHQLRNLCRDAIVEDVREASGVRELRPTAEAAERAVADFRLALGASVQRTPWQTFSQNASFVDAIAALDTSLKALTEVLQATAAHGPGLANCARRASALSDRLVDIVRGDDCDRVAWIETTARGFALRVTPLDVAAPFQACTRALGTQSWIYTSATLAVGDDFTHFTRRLGLEAARSARWQSPFDYSRQTLLYIPTGLPDPGSSDHTRAAVEAAMPVLRASGGRAFFLFTSHRALKFAADLLQERLSYPLLIQGAMSRSRLLETFIRAGNAVLLGTASFWEGVDVRGPTLSCVIIEKLPFAAPDDPVLQARAAACAAEGRNPFMEYQIPDAVIALKQGAGRLIRSIADSGVLVLCDPRLYTRSYGALFLDSLPPMPITRDVADVERFFREMLPVEPTT